MSEYVTIEQLTAAGTEIGTRIKAASVPGGSSGGSSRYPAGLVANRTTEFYTAFLSTSPWDSFFVGTQTGTGAIGTSIVVDTLLNDASYVRIETGTTATGRASVSNGLAAFRARAGKFHKFKTRVTFVDAASNATDTYEAIIGFTNTTTGAATYAAHFRMATTGVFQAVTRNNGTETITVLTDPPLGSPQTYEVIIDEANEVKFYIDGVLVATHTTGLPTSAFMSPSVHIRKTVGVTVRRLRCYFAALQSTMP